MPSWLLVTAVLQGFSLIAAVVGVGWLVAHVGLFGPAEQKMLGTLTFRVGSPALLFLVVADADVAVVFSGFLVASLAAVVPLCLPPVFHFATADRFRPMSVQAL